MKFPCECFVNDSCNVNALQLVSCSAPPAEAFQDEPCGFPSQWQPRRMELSSCSYQTLSNQPCCPLLSCTGHSERSICSPYAPHMLPTCSPYVPRRAISFLFAWIAASLPYLACSAFLEAKIQVTACECKRDQNGPKSSWCSNYAKIIQNQIQQQTNSVVKFSSELLSELHSSRACTSASAEAKKGFSSTPNVTAAETAIVAASVWRSNWWILPTSRDLGSTLKSVWNLWGTDSSYGQQSTLLLSLLLSGFCKSCSPYTFDSNNECEINHKTTVAAESTERAAKTWLCLIGQCVRKRKGESAACNKQFLTQQYHIHFTISKWCVTRSVYLLPSEL